MENWHSKKGKYHYKAFGLNIDSSIFLPGLLPGIGKVDIVIELGIIPSEIGEVLEKGENYQISKNQLLFHIEEAGKYFVTNGNRIVVQPRIGSNEHLVVLYLLGTAFGALLLQRGVLPVHGSTVVINGCGTIFTGNQGAGKSTLSSAFRKRGCLFLADDISVITQDSEGFPWVQPAFPQQKLCMDSIDAVGDKISLYRQIDADRDKYAIPVREEFALSPVRLSAVCEIRVKECNRTEMVKVAGTEKLLILMKNIYRIELLKWFGLKAEYFRQLLDVAANTAFFRLTRPKGVFDLEEQVQLVERELKQKDKRSKRYEST